MIDLFFGACDLLRPILFFVLLGYVPMKLGISFDVAGKPPSAAEIRNTITEQLQRIAGVGLFSVFLIPMRLLVVAYFSIWLIVDKSPWLLVALFVLSLLPLHFK